MKAWCHQGLVPSRPGSITAWCHQGLVPSRPGAIKAWCHQGLVPSRPGAIKATLFLHTLKPDPTPPDLLSCPPGLYTYAMTPNAHSLP